MNSAACEVTEDQWLLEGRRLALRNGVAPARPLADLSVVRPRLRGAAIVRPVLDEARARVRDWRAPRPSQSWTMVAVPLLTALTIVLLVIVPALVENVLA